MKQFRKRSPNDAIAIVSSSQTQIDIIKSHLEIDFIEPTYLEKHLAANRSARPGDCRQRPSQSQLTEIARIIPGGKAMHVSRLTIRPQHNAAMLQLLVCVE